MKLIIGVLIAGMLTSCGWKSPEGMSAYVADPENGLLKKTDESHWQYQLQMVPGALQCYMDADKPVRADQFDSISKEYEGALYYRFLISDKGGREVLDFLKNENGLVPDSVLYELNYNGHKNLRVVMGADTLPGAIALRDQLNHFSAPISYLMSVPLQTKDQLQKAACDSIEVQWNDHLLSRHWICFRFAKKDITKIPSIKI
ncbi:MAG: hypothetical protein U0T73_08615 [Chitinophagales bacterium]